jgi:tRNA threonylcarbamoyladenosine biosynthesis protein TsaB
MAIRTWCALLPRPVFAYSSLELCSAGLGETRASLIADARRDSWHHYPPGGPLGRLPTSDLAGPLLTPEGFRNWTPLPAGVGRVPYLLSELMARTASADLLRPVEAPDARLPFEPSYAVWKPQIHRAP